MYILMHELRHIWLLGNRAYSLFLLKQVVLHCSYAGFRAAQGVEGVIAPH